MRWLVAIAVTIVAPAAHAEPVIVGAGVGSLREAAGSSTSLDLWTRIFIRPNVATQFELSRVDTSGALSVMTASPGTSDITQTNNLLVIDLGSNAIVPTLLFGTGVDHASNSARDNTYAHAEVGVGLELRGHGVVLGVDARAGDRMLVTHSETDVMPFSEPRMLDEGTYHSVRLSLGFEF